jgi:hypothetical protein
MKKCITSNQEGVAGIIIVIGALLLLVVGGLAGSMVPDMLKNKNTPEVKPTVSIVEPTVIPEPSVSQGADDSKTLQEKGFIEGGLSYPSSGIPSDVGVCAELVENTGVKTCGEQIKDKKFKNGVGFKLEVAPGVYYVYAFKGEQKAYYNQFVLCGLSVACKDRTKIPVIVKSGQVSEAMPEDWYDEVTPSTKPTLKPLMPKITIAPSATPTSTKLIINPNILQKITFPSATPTPIKIVVPTIKINLPDLGL